MKDRYQQEVEALEAEIAYLEGRAERFKARGRDTRITEDTIAELRARIPTLRGTSKIVQALYG